VSLIQVSADVGTSDTWQREVRALVSAVRLYPGATPVLLTADAQPPVEALPAPLVWQPVSAWLLGDRASP
jgi:hypothetical protein